LRLAVADELGGLRLTCRARRGGPPPTRQRPLPPSATIGIPAAVAASIAGTVVVVFGIADSVGVAVTGAIAFALLVMAEHNAREVLLSRR